MTDHESISDEEPKMTAEELITSISDTFYEALKAFDPDNKLKGQIKTSQLKDFIEYCNFKMDDNEVYLLASELDPTQCGEVDSAALKSEIMSKEIARKIGSSDDELLDAYVAMGGEANGGGCVDATKLIKTIKEEF